MHTDREHFLTVLSSSIPVSDTVSLAGFAERLRQAGTAKKPQEAAPQPEAPSAGEDAEQAVETDAEQHPDAVDAQPETADSPESADSPETVIKNHFLRGTAEPVVLSSAEEFARLLAWCFLCAFRDNGKAPLLAVKKLPDLSAAEREQKFREVIARSALYAPKLVKKTGELEFDPKDGIPKLLKDVGKLAALLDNPFPSLRGEQLADPKRLEQLEKFQSMVVTHPAKLSCASASGGFLLERHVATPYSWLVGEGDFGVAPRVTNAASAGLQALWPVLLSKAVWKEELRTLMAHLHADSALRKEVFELFDQADVQGLPSVLQTALSAPGATLEGEAQVFVGKAPSFHRVSPLAPYALFLEIDSVRQTLRTKRSDEDKARMAELRALLQGLKEQRTELKGKRYQEARDALDARIAQCKAELAELKDAMAGVLLSSVEVPIGGNNPRNMALDLDTRVHRANIRLTVPNLRHDALRQAQGRVFFNALLTQPRLRRQSRAPASFRPGANNSLARIAREQLVSDIVAQVLAPLQSLLAQGGSSELAKHPVYGPFVARPEGADPRAHRAALQPLAHEVYERVLGALKAAYPAESLSPEHFAHVRQFVEESLYQEVV